METCEWERCPAPDEPIDVVRDDGDWHEECLDQWIEEQAERYRPRVVQHVSEVLDEEFGYALDDPKHPTWLERMLDAADNRRDEIR